MKIIFFSSHSATWYYTFAEAVLANALQKKGYEVLFITPGNQLPRISNLLHEKILREKFNLKGYEIDKKLTSKDYKQINLILKNLNKNNFEKLKIKNILIGKISLYEFLLHHKKVSLNLSNSEWKECLLEIKDTLISLFSAQLIIDQEKPDRILMYSSLYSVNHVWKKYAEHKKIPVYFIHHGMNFSDMDNKLIIAKKNSFHYVKNLKKYWSKLNKVPISIAEAKYVTNNFLELLKAKHFLIYSTPKSKESLSIRKIFNINKDQKILVATMSSYDELFAAQYVGAWKMPKKIMFPTQIDWIKELIKYAKEKQNLFLIIRVHPREFPNKRESRKSEHAKILEKIFKTLPKNVKINWPYDNISIYDLAKETDVFLNAWSTVGVEASLLGIPVVLYSKELVLYPSELNTVGKNKKDYFNKIELALKKGWNYKKIKETYRWLSLYYYHTTIRFRKKMANQNKLITSKTFFNISNYFYNLLSPKIRSFFSNNFSNVGWLKIGERQRTDCELQLKERVDISEVEKMLIESRDTLIDMKKISKNKITSKEEDIFIRNELKRIYKALYNGDNETTKIKKNSLQYNLKRVIS